MKKVPIGDIQIGERHRKDLGDIDTLAASLDAEGLLQPPAITTDGRLVFGERRIEAAKRLGWDRIEVRVIDPPSLIRAEWAENELRKQFTKSERVAIGRAIEADIGNRRGQRTDINELPKNIKEVPPGKETAEIAAEIAGFGNRITYRQAGKVVDEGVPELVEAMDKEEVSIAAAAEVATLPKPEQKEVVKQGPKAVRKAAKQVRKKRKAKSNGQAGPPVIDDGAESSDQVWGGLWQKIDFAIRSIQRGKGFKKLFGKKPRHFLEAMLEGLTNLRETTERGIEEIEEMLR